MKGKRTQKKQFSNRQREVAFIRVFMCVCVQERANLGGRPTDCRCVTILAREIKRSKLETYASPYLQ